MGGCATKPKVKAEKVPVPAPAMGEEVVGDGEKDVVVDEAGREIVQAGEEKKAEAVSFRHSLSNLLNQAVEKEDKAKGDGQQTESIERELESESIKLEETIEKGAELIELPKEEQPSELEKQVAIEAERTFYCGKSELVEAENPKLPVPQVITSEALKFTEAVSFKLDEPTKVVAAAAEIPPSSETPKLSEVTKTEEVAPVVPQAVSPKLDEATKVVVAAAAAAEIPPSSETPKLPEITKTEDATPVVPQSETLNPADSTNTFPAASETLKPSELKKEEAAAATLSETETPKPSVSTKTIDAPAETKIIVQEKESPPPNVEQKPTATASESANP